MTKYAIRSIEHGGLLAAFDPDFHPDTPPIYPCGFVTWTERPSEAMTFDTMQDAIDLWHTQSTVIPFRPDGEPNRPLTSFSVDIVVAPETVILPVSAGWRGMLRELLDTVTTARPAMHTDETIDAMQALAVMLARVVDEQPDTASPADVVVAMLATMNHDTDTRNRDATMQLSRMVGTFLIADPAIEVKSDLMLALVLRTAEALNDWDDMADDVVRHNNQIADIAAIIGRAHGDNPS